MATVADLLKMKKKLKDVSDTASLDVELLLCHCLQKNRSFCKAWPDAEVPEVAEEQFRLLLKRRINGEPIAYLLGERGFWTLDLAVNESTLIPRPETELLVEKALELMAGKDDSVVLDLGTGTGAIALALAVEQPGWTISACDVQQQAVALAEKNSRRYKLSNVRVFQSDWFSAIENQRFDLIVSNPPYIDEIDPHLSKGDVRFEPRSALVADKQGLADIEKIVEQSPAFLKHAGWLVFEHGYQQGAVARGLLQQLGFSRVFTDKDLAGHQRISGGCWLGDTDKGGDNEGTMNGEAP